MLEYKDKIINSGRFALEEELNSTWKKIEKKSLYIMVEQNFIFFQL